MLVDLDATALARAAQAVPASHAACCVANVTRASDVRAVIDATLKKWGAVDVLFSNAGNPGVIAPLADYPESVFDDVYAVHVKGAFLMCKYALPHVRDGGSMIITSSVAGLRGDGGVYADIPAQRAQA